MRSQLSADVIVSLRSAAARLTGFQRRQFQAEMAEKYCEGQARRAERVFGWGRVAVETGLNERRTGIRCLDNFHQRGRKKSEVTDPQLERDVRAIVEPHSQADPKFQSAVAFTRVTAAAVRTALAEQLRETGRHVPARRTLSTMLNRLGYRLRRVQKTRPEKKFPRRTPSSPAFTRLISGRRPTRNA